MELLIRRMYPVVRQCKPHQDGRQLEHVLKGVDVRLDLSAAEALQKWQFAPAERDGVPVEVDIIAEIPFLLAPQAKP